MKKLKYYLLLLLCFGILGCTTPTTPELTPTPKQEATPAPEQGTTPTPEQETTPTPEPTAAAEADWSEIPITLQEIPEYTTEPYVVIHGNVPFFEVSKTMTDSFEIYGELDELGRCTLVYANIGTDLMPTEDRGSIGSVKPTGWHTVKYDIVEGNYLYNRCHLIGYQLTGENANRQNLITGTRYMNVIGMLPFENMVADYIRETGNHVMYRVLPMFDDNNLLAAGVLMEAWSVEDEGEGICFNVFVYNVQPGVTIDYATGNSELTEDAYEQNKTDEDVTYVLNINTKKFHYPYCGSVSTMKESNRMDTTETREELIEQGYKPCGNCNP